MISRRPPPYNKSVAAFARFTRSGERGTEAAPATSGRYKKSAGADVVRSPGQRNRGQLAPEWLG